MELPSGGAEVKTRFAWRKAMPFPQLSLLCPHLDGKPVTEKGPRFPSLALLGSTCTDFPNKVEAGHEQLRVSQ